MIKKELVLILVITILFTACSQENPEEVDTTAMVEKALLDELFKEAEKLIEDIKNKAYINASDKISKIYELSNKSGFTPSDSFENSQEYFDALNALTTSITNEADKQKLNEIYYEFEKSIIEIAASMESESGGGSSGASDSDGEGGSSEEEGKEEEIKGSSSGEEEDGKEEESASGVIIVQEELLKQYPELIITQNDKELKKQAITLLAYISQKILETNPGEDQSLLKRQKVYFYSAASLAELDKFDDALAVMETAENEWEAFMLANDSKDKSEIKTLSTIIKNTTESLTKENAISVDVQKDIAIEAIDDLSDKLISEKMEEKS